MNIRMRRGRTPTRLSGVNTDGEMKTGVRYTELGEKGLRAVVHLQILIPRTPVSNDSGGGASAWGSGGKKGQVGLCSVAEKRPQEVFGGHGALYVCDRMELERVGRGERRWREREMMSENEDSSRAAAQSATVLTHHSFHFSFLISPIPVTA